MASSSRVKLTDFRKEVNLDDFVDYLLSEKLINENEYYEVWSEVKDNRINLLLRKIEQKSNDNIQKVINYLSVIYPHIEERERENHDYHVALVRGGFPKLPPNYVNRETCGAILRKSLEELEIGSKVVVHGLIGYGKSCLVNEVLQDKFLIKNCFDYKVFWINLGEHHNLDNILVPMWRLYSSSIVLTNEAPISHCPDNVEKLKSLLEQIFLDFDMRKSLIILDDVCVAKVANVFDFGCKMVITTQNKKLVPDKKAQFVEIETGFSENESLELFYNSIGKTPTVTHNAKKIHECCKGHPLVIGIIGSFLKDNLEDSKNNSKIWEYVGKKLIEGEYDRLNSDGNETITNAIKICVLKLPNDLLEYYYQLVIFQEDVNIIPEVLTILWDKDIYEVRRIMNQLANRSLIVSFYHKDHKSYIYGVHDLHLKYLKFIKKDDIVNYHKKLIDGYNRVTKGNFSNLPNDNYSLQYIGYHLKGAEVYDKFNIYFSFKFLEAKIRAAGYADVVRDMDNYEKYITYEDPILRNKLRDYRNFISCYGADIYNNDKIDIVQIALQERKDSIVYTDAYNSACNDNSAVYFKMELPKDQKNSTLKINIDDEITSACYVNNKEQILIATATGNIEFYENQRCMYSLHGHTKAVCKMELNKTKTHLLSVSDDHTVRLWKLKTTNRRSFDVENNGPVPSPKDKQNNWMNMYQKEPSINSLLFKLTNSNDEFLTSAVFSPDYKETHMIATGTNNGKVIIWNTMEQTQICSTTPRGFVVNCLAFVKFSNRNNPSVIFICGSSILLFNFVNGNTLQYWYSLFHEEVISLFVNTFDDDKSEIITVSDNHITYWMIDTHTQKTVYHPKRNNNICATLTTDIKYLIVSTKENIVYIWDYDKRKVTDEIHYWGVTKSLDTLYDDNNSVNMLLITSDRKTLQQCEIKPEDKEIKTTNMVFSSYWSGEKPFTAVINENENKIQVYHVYQLLVETDTIVDMNNEDRRITYTIFLNKDKIIYGLKNGEIRRFEIKSKNDIQLTKLNGAVTYLQIINLSENGDDKLLIAASENTVQILFNKPSYIHDFIDPVLFFKIKNKLFIVERDGNISTWDLVTFDVESKYKYDKGYHVTTASVCLNKKYLAVTTYLNDHYLSIFQISPEIKKICYIKLDNQPTSSCFSFNGKLLAVGMKSGLIQVWTISTQVHLAMNLELHETPVEYLIFSPGLEPILVSLGNQIAWWNLKAIEPRQNITNGSFKMRTLQLLENMDISNENHCNMDLQYWSEKQKFKDNRYLLSCIKLHSQYAKILSASPNFTSFLTVDEKGKIYIMEVISTSNVNN